MEIKNSYVDLVDRQMSGTQKKEGKTEDGISGFKNLLKEKHQKKNMESENHGSDAQTPGAEAIIPHLNGKVDELQREEAALFIPAQKLLETQTGMEASAGAVPVNHESANRSGTISQIQMLNPFNMKNQPDGEKQIISNDGIFSEVLTGKSKKDSGVFLLHGLNSQQTGDQTDGADALKLLKDADQAMKLTALSNDALTDTALTEDGTNAEVLAAAKNGRLFEKKGTVKEEKVSENVLGNVQEKRFEPARVIRMEDKAVAVTVNENNPEELEAKLSEQILSQIRTGKNNLELQLEPHNLGKILLKISYEENQVNVSIVCSESKTLKLLSHSANEIGSILEANVERPFQVMVDKQEADYLQNQQQNQQDGRQEQQQHHQQQNHTDDNAEDFIQKLRLGFFGEDSGIYSQVSD